MHKVIVDFADLQDNNYRYHTGDTFPRKGIEVSAERLEELLTDKNRRRKPMIEEVKEPKPAKEPKPVVEEEKPKTQPKNGRKKKTDVK